LTYAKTLMARKVHAFDMDPGDIRGDPKTYWALCGRGMRFSGWSKLQNEVDFSLSPCKPCMENWKPLRVAQIIGEEKS